MEKCVCGPPPPPPPHCPVLLVIQVESPTMRDPD